MFHALSHADIKGGTAYLAHGHLILTKIVSTPHNTSIIIMIEDPMLKNMQETFLLFRPLVPVLGCCCSPLFA